MKLCKCTSYTLSGKSCPDSEVGKCPHIDRPCLGDTVHMEDDGSKRNKGEVDLICVKGYLNKYEYIGEGKWKFID